jgi:nitrogen fixation NifU-like protein
MDELRELYQELILDHNRRPRNFRVPPEASHDAEGNNPLCGDVVHVYLRVADGRVEDAAFQGRGCAISTASASLMTEAVRGRSAEEARRMFGAFQRLVTSDPTQPALDDPTLGKLAVFAGVREYPVRVKCATLPWHTLVAALERRSAPVSTE